MIPELALCGFAVLVGAFHLVQHIVSRRLDRQEPDRIAVPQPRPSVWPTSRGPGRHRRAGAAPDAWLAWHSLVCAHLQMPHTTTLAGLVCDECGNTIPGGPMYDDHDFADEVERPTREEEKASEIAHDIAAEERLAELEALAANAPEDGGDEECYAEFIDGSFTDCGCVDCEDRVALEAEEAGEL